MEDQVEQQGQHRYMYVETNIPYRRSTYWDLQLLKLVREEWTTLDA